MYSSRAIASRVSIRTLKTWTTNGKLDEAKRHSYFVADQKANAEKLIISGVRDGNFSLLHGPRSSGKSTLCDVAGSMLKDDFTVLNADFQRVRLNAGEDIFWDSFGRELVCNNSFLPHIASARDFIDLFGRRNWEKTLNVSKTTNTPSHDKPVVIFIDEFDEIYFKSDETTQDSLLGALRGIKQDQSNFCVRSFVGIGSFSVLNLLGGTGSPFSVREAILCPNLSEEQVRTLFKEYADTRRIVIDPNVISDIYYRTSGHAGSVSFFGKFIDEHDYFSSDNNITSDKWQDIIASTNVVRECMKWVPMQKMIKRLSFPYRKFAGNSTKSAGNLIELSPLILEANDTLYKYILTNNDPVECHPETRDLFDFLASEGAVAACDNSSFKIRSPLVKSLLLSELVPLMRRKTIEEPVPLINGRLDVPSMITQIVKHWDRNWLALYGAHSRKLSRANGVPRTTRAPREEVYQLELVSSLKSWLPLFYDVFTQVVVENERCKRTDMYADVMIQMNEERILLELVAHTGKDNVAEHINRAGEYAKVLKATSTYVIHFTSSPKIDEYPFCTGNEEVSVIHVYHSPSFDVIKIYQHKGEEPTII